MLAAGAALIVLLAVVRRRRVSGGHRPTGDYAPFADCPLSNPATDVCIFAQTESGELMIGRKTIPITRTITLQGGVHQNEATGKQEFIGAEGGDTLSRTPQVVPGGLRASSPQAPAEDPCGSSSTEFIARGAGEVTATIELAAPASSIGMTPRI